MPLVFDSSGDYIDHEHGLDTVTAITGWEGCEKDEPAANDCLKPEEKLNESQRGDEETSAIGRETRLKTLADHRRGGRFVQYKLMKYCSKGVTMRKE